MPLAGSRHVTALTLAVLTALSGCAAYQPAPRSFNEAALQPYHVDSGDRLRINVFEQVGLTNTYTVDQAGYVAFPLVGQVPARGKTLPQLEAAIAAKLRQGYLRDPDVTIEIDRYRPVFIMGEVGRPGQYSYVPGMTVQNAIAIAAWFFPARQPGGCRHYPQDQCRGDDRPHRDQRANSGGRYRLCTRTLLLKTER